MAKVKNPALGEKDEYVVHGTIAADKFVNRETGEPIGAGDTYTKEQIDEMLAAIREGQYVEVDTTEYPTLEDFLESEGQQGTVYLYPVENQANNYYQYIWENGTWKSLGSTELDLADYYTKEESDAKYVDLTSNQTIIATKTITAQLDFAKGSGAKLSIYNDNGYNAKIRMGTTENIRLMGGGTYFGTVISPISTSSNTNLGSSANKWRDLYLAGKIKDGTNEFDYNTLGLPVISKPASTTLTSDEVTRISKGAIFLGASDNKFLGYEKIVFFPLGDTSFGENGGFALCVNGFNPEVRVYRINNSNVISIQDSTAQGIRLQSVQQINGKQIPAYPTTNTEKQVPVIAPNGGALSWDNPFNPASVAVVDGGTITDTALKENIQSRRPIVLNGYTGYFSCDDGTNYQYASTIYDASTNSIHYNVITINKTTWVVTFHVKNLSL